MDGHVHWSKKVKKVKDFLLFLSGTSLSVIININLNVAIVTSAAVTTLYTMIGQMISVAYTDIIQLSLILFGLVMLFLHTLLHAKLYASANSMVQNQDSILARFFTVCLLSSFLVINVLK